jgi:DNA modification methylase
MIHWHIEVIPLKCLKDHPKNPRQISKEQMLHLQTLIEKFGLIDKPVVNKDWTIIGGHQRIRILRKMKAKTVECWIPDVQLSQEDIDHLCIGLNLNQGSFDFDILANQWDALDLLKWGFTEEQLLGECKSIEEIESEEDDANLEVGKESEAITQPGDLYELGDHRLLCGSATDILAMEKLANNISVDLVITDPPYNVDYVGKTKDALKIQNDSMSDASFYQFLHDAYVNMFALCKEGASIYVFHADMEGMNFRKAFKDAGFKLSECLVWLKNSMVMGRQDYHWKHEPILYGWKEGEAHKWYSDRTQTTVLEFDRPSRSEEHPTMKPIPLVGYLMKNSSKSGDYILDPFLGSGTTLITAEQLGRKCIGIELSPAYCDVIVKRWIEYRKKKDLSCEFKCNGLIMNELKKENGE